MKALKEGEKNRVGVGERERVCMMCVKYLERLQCYRGHTVMEEE